MPNATPVTLTGPSGARIRGGYFAAAFAELTGAVTGADAVASGSMAPAPTPPPPPPPAPPPGAPGGLTLLSATTNASTPFCVGFGFRQGDIPSGIAVAGATTQATVKNTWPDGSVKFAILAGRANLSAGVAAAVLPSAGTASSGAALTLTDLQAVPSITASITAGAFGSASWSGADWASPFEIWVTGHKMSSWIYRKPIGSDPHLAGWLEVRLFEGSIVEVLPFVENGMLMVTGPTSKSAIYTFTLGGVLRYTSGSALDIPHHCRTPLVSGTAISYWLGMTDPDVIVKHDGAYLQKTGLVPPYFASTPPSAASVTSLPSTYAPMQQGSWPSGMGSGGYHKSIGVIPEWDVAHMTSTATSTYKGVIFNAYSAGRYAYHYRDESDGHRPPRIALYPTLQVGRDPEGGYVTTPLASGTASPSWSVSHQPSPGYMAYLITGRRYFLDELQFAAATNPLIMPSSQRQAALGIFDSASNGNERHHAWCMRTVSQAAAVTPDVAPVAADTALLASFRGNLTNNIDYYHGRYIGASNDALNPRVANGGWVQATADLNSGFLLINGTVAAGATTTVIAHNSGGFKQSSGADDQFVGWQLTIGAESRTVTDYVLSTRTFTVSPGFTSAPAAGAVAWVDDGVCFTTNWMQDFIQLVWGYMRDLGLQLGTTATQRHDRLYAWKAASIVNRCGFTGATEWLYRDFAPYYIAIAPTDNPNWDAGTGPWFANPGQAYDATYAGRTNQTTSLAPYLSLGARVEGPIRSAILDPQFSGTVAAIAALAMAVKQGVAGAEAAWQRITTASNWHAAVTNFDSEPVWALSPFALPTWRSGQAVNEYRTLANTQNALTPASNHVTGTGGQEANGAGFSTSYRLGAWCGLSVDTRRSTVWSVANGGHGDYFGNEILFINLRSDIPAWLERHPGSNGGVADYEGDPTDPSKARYLDTPYVVAAWAPSTAYSGSVTRRNGIRTYTLTTPGTSAASGGPTGTGTGITDGTCVWSYFGVTVGVKGAGLPVSTHSYYGQQFMERQSRAVRAGGSVSPVGSGFETVEGFNVDLAYGVNGWDAPGTFGLCIGAGNGGWTPAIGWAMCKDPSTECIYTVNGASIRKMVPTVGGIGGTWSVLAGLPGGINTGALGATAVDTTRNRLVWMFGYGSDVLDTCDLATGVWTVRSFPASAAATALAGMVAWSNPGGGAKPQSLGLIYVPPLDAFIVRGGAAGDLFYKIDAATFAVSVLTITGGSSIPAVLGLSDQQNVFNRLLYDPALRGASYFASGGDDGGFLRLF